MILLVLNLDIFYQPYKSCLFSTLFISQFHAAFSKTLLILERNFCK